TTLIQEKSDVAMQGRVFGLLSSAYSGFLPLGMAVFGPMADAVPLSRIMVASGAALVIIALAVRFSRDMYAGKNQSNFHK
ncbi:MAG: MFS transporter, partial [Clostridia bacterium]|nr:MFS transporter [Clostridia bacterium]